MKADQSTKEWYHNEAHLEAIANADAHLSNVGLPSYTELYDLVFNLKDELGTVIVTDTSAGRKTPIEVVNVYESLVRTQAQMVKGRPNEYPAATQHSEETKGILVPTRN